MLRHFSLIVLMAVALPAHAGIAVFTDGRTQKISDFRAEGDRVDLTLPDGGHLEVPLLRVDRIVDDEIAASKEEIAELPRLFPKKNWRYDDSAVVDAPPGWEALIRDAARTHDVDPSLVAAVIRAESNFDRRAVSRKGARGAMQLMPATALRFGVTNTFDASQNIHGGTRYLRWLLDRFDRDVERTVAAYNAGEGAVEKYAGVPPYRETVEYVKRVSRHVRGGEAAGAGVQTGSR